MEPSSIAILFTIGLAAAQVTTVAGMILALKRALHFRATAKNLTTPYKKNNCTKRWYANLTNSARYAVAACVTGLVLWAAIADLTPGRPPAWIVDALLWAMAAAMMVLLWSSRRNDSLVFENHISVYP